jgi:hypothetical protein
MRNNGEVMIGIASKGDGHPTRNGEYAVRFHLRDNDKIPNDSTRAELGFWPPEPRNVERWYSLSLYLKNWDRDHDRDVIFQWHQGGTVPCPTGCSRP